MKSLNDVKPGDILIERSTYSTNIVTVKRVTSTLIVVNNRRYRKKDGRVLGGDIWSCGKVEIPKEGQIESIQQAKYISNVTNKLLKMSKSYNITYEQAVKIAEILNISENL